MDRLPVEAFRPMSRLRRSTTTGAGVVPLKMRIFSATEWNLRNGASLRSSDGSDAKSCRPWISRSGSLWSGRDTCARDTEPVLIFFQNTVTWVREEWKKIGRRDEERKKLEELDETEPEFLV